MDGSPRGKPRKLAQAFFFDRAVSSACLAESIFNREPLVMSC
jgi:hypothetical protein